MASRVAQTERGFALTDLVDDFENQDIEAGLQFYASYDIRIAESSLTRVSLYP